VFDKNRKPGAAKLLAFFIGDIPVLSTKPDERAREGETHHKENAGKV